jgi:hypothetical protein
MTVVCYFFAVYRKELKTFETKNKIRYNLASAAKNSIVSPVFRLHRPIPSKIPI